jgi:hypothetical protein
MARWQYMRMNTVLYLLIFIYNKTICGQCRVFNYFTKYSTPCTQFHNTFMTITICTAPCCPNGDTTGNV